MAYKFRCTRAHTQQNARILMCVCGVGALLLQQENCDDISYPGLPYPVKTIKVKEHLRKEKFLFQSIRYVRPSNFFFANI